MPRKGKLTKKPVITLEQKLPEVPGRSPYEIPTQHLEKDGKGGYKIIKGRRPSKTLLAGQLRKEIDDWRGKDYPDICGTTRRLLDYWFEEEHYLPNGEKFQFYFCQREAIEAIIYLYEVKRIYDVADLVEKYMDPAAYANDLFTKRKQIMETVKEKRILSRLVPETGQLAHQELPPPDLTRYAIKMATGSGKTVVMAMVVAWSYFHRRFEKNSNLSNYFLIIAPNVIVFERLRLDFENGIIFTEKKFPLIPPEWKNHWQLSFIMRGESKKAGSSGGLYLTNIQQLYESRTEEIVNVVERVLGPRPEAETGTWEEDILDRIRKHNNLMILNDEGHHVHDPNLEWYKVISRLHEDLKARTGKGLTMQLDFSATPKDQNGTFFSWIITDYPLAQAIEDRIVKSPLIAHQVDKVDPEKYDRASVAYGEWINVAISRWQEHFDAYGKVGKKPVLFIMAENTKDADDIYNALKMKEPFKRKDQVLLIHTDKTGEITKKDLGEARGAARSIDEKTNKIRAIVSVLMLREGWDVQNVSVILGLRPFTSKARILPEQAIGRGLRNMSEVGPGYVQILELIGTNAFEDFVKQLELEGVGIASTKTPPTPGVHIFPVKKKLEYDIEIPILTPAYKREFSGISTFDITELPKNPNKIAVKKTMRGKVDLKEMVTQKTVAKKQVIIDVGIPIAEDIISHITNRILQAAHLQGHFASVYPLVRKYLRKRFFGEKIDLESQAVRRLLTAAQNVNSIVDIFSKALGKHISSRTEVGLEGGSFRLADTETFLWRREVVEAKHTIFNRVPCYNQFEIDFAKFLDGVSDITKFSKLAEWFTRFYIEYLSSNGAIRHYYPDFLAEQKLPKNKKKMWIIETKGREDPEVVLKDARTIQWCKDATKLTGIEWSYVKVPYIEFYSTKFSDFQQLIKYLVSVQRRRKEETVTLLKNI